MSAVAMAHEMDMKLFRSRPAPVLREGNWVAQFAMMRGFCLKTSRKDTNQITQGYYDLVINTIWTARVIIHPMPALISCLYGVFWMHQATSGCIRMHQDPMPALISL
jgi:hypothetical protein